MNAWTQFHAKLHTHLLAKDLLPRDTAILIAVSGGQDSLCLVKILSDLQSKWNWRLGVVHCDHGWRADSIDNAQHVEQCVAQWHLPCWIEQASPELPTTEAAARQWRYSVLEAVALTQGYQVVVTGHTATDRAETVLYNLMRGAGGDGLSSLVWQRPLSQTAAHIQLVRPLLDWNRTETDTFCQTQNLSVWHDSTNTDLSYRRNRIRHELMPYLRSHFNPNVEQMLAQTAEILTAEVDYLDAQINECYGAIVVEQSLDTAWHLDRSLFRKLPLALQRRLVRKLLKAALPQQPQFGHIEKIVALAHAPNRSQTDPFPGNFVAQVRDHVIWLGLP